MASLGLLPGLSPGLWVCSQAGASLGVSPSVPAHSPQPRAPWALAANRRPQGAGEEVGPRALGATAGDPGLPLGQAMCQGLILVTHGR